MPTLVALIRGINVGGKHIIRMADLRALCERLGFSSVTTYLQSGNVVFDTGARSAKVVSPLLEEAIRSQFEFEAAVVVRTPSELASVIKCNPYVDEAANDSTRVHVAFLATRPAAARVRAMRVPESAEDSFRVVGREIYLHYPNGAGRTKLTNAFFERGLGVVATARNWRTVIALNQLIANGERK